MNDGNQVERHLVDAKTMAKILDVPKSWIYQRTRPGAERIPVVRLGKYVRFKPADVILYYEGKVGSA